MSACDPSIQWAWAIVGFVGGLSTLLVCLYMAMKD
jgi:hypothetical protein